MKPKVLFAWVGLTDLRASAGQPDVGRGPIGQAVSDGDYSRVVLLCDHGPEEEQHYCRWLQRLTKATIIPHHVVLTSPTSFGEIYSAAVLALEAAQKDAGKEDADLVYHLSPGTPAMAAVWILLAKTTYPAELIESSAKLGVRKVSIPFQISADYAPERLRDADDDIQLLTRGLPPEAPEFANIVYRCRAMGRLVAKARVLAAHEVPILIQGESGTGKELFARAIHASSGRKTAPFVAVNCGAIPSELVESEFFGHTKGAFTGAVSARAGYLEQADGGTLFLDEIGELPGAAQVKLLRSLQDGSVQRVGADRPAKVNLRVIAATNRNLMQEMARGAFREDLFHRLAVGVLQLPPLRDRREDLGLLVDHVLERINTEFGKMPGWQQKKLSAGARNLLVQHSWPGNVRELINTLSRAAIWTAGNTMAQQDIQESILPAPKGPSDRDDVLNRPLDKDLSLPAIMDDVARHYLQRALVEAGGNKTLAAGLVGLPSYQTFTNWLRKYGVSR